MAKNKEYYANGVREFSSIKGCHSCLDCEHCVQQGTLSGQAEYQCKKLVGKNSSLDRRFPYDNTKCKKFQEQSR